MKHKLTMSTNCKLSYHCSITCE